MRGLIEALLIKLCAVYVKLSPTRRLSDPILSTERALAYAACDGGTLARVLGDRRLSVLDVGARGGPIDFLTRFPDRVDTVLCEPDPAERDRLTARGFEVIDSLLGAAAGEASLNITRNPGNSSTLEPDGPMLAYYAGDRARFDVMQRIALPVRTLDSVVTERGRPFDAIKLDTQGSELAILEGGETARPLLWFTEVSSAHLYRDQGTLFEIGGLLHARGYVMADLALRRVRPKPIDAHVPPGGRASLGLPLHGDAAFVADWTRPEGRALIRGREAEWAALMLLAGHEEVLRHALSTGAIDGAEDLLRRLDGR